MEAIAGKNFRGARAVCPGCVQQFSKTLFLLCKSLWCKGLICCKNLQQNSAGGSKRRGGA